MYLATFGPGADEGAHLAQYRARMEATVLENMAAAREIYEVAVKQGHGGQASVWLAYANLERAHGSTEGCRKILRRAVQVCPCPTPTSPTPTPTPTRPAASFTMCGCNKGRVHCAALPMVSCCLMKCYTT